MDKILLATDGSKDSQKAAAMVTQFMDAWQDAELTVLYVIQPHFYPGDTLIPQEIVDAERQYAREVEQQARETFARWNDRVRFQTKNGQVAVTICDTAAALNADLIVVGSHGRGALDRLLVGSVSQAVLHRAKATVMVVK